MTTIHILDQEVDEEEGVYRVLVGEKVKYLLISADVFDNDTMCRPYLLIPKLPIFPDEEWTGMSITRPRKSSTAAPGALKTVATNEPLAEVETVWHNKRIDGLTLEHTKRHRFNVHEVVYNGTPTVSKIAAFEWQIPRLEKETWAYSILNQHQCSETNERHISPRVLDHLTEGGRVTGLLLERLDGRFASIEDLSECTAALRTLHDIGLTHGDVNRYNFIIDKNSGKASMLDFEHASGYDEATAAADPQSLASELRDETGRGGPTRTL